MKKIYKLFLGLAVFASLFLAGCTDPVFYYIENDVVSEKPTINGVIRSMARYTTTSGDEYLITVGSNGFIYKRVFDGFKHDWDTETQKHGAWTYVGEEQLPFQIHKYNYVNTSHSGQQIIKAVSDNEYIYLVTVEYFDNDEGLSTPCNIHVWAAKPEAAVETATSSADNSNWKTLSASDWKDIVAEYNTANESNILQNAFYVYDSYTHSDFNVFFTNSPKKENRSSYIRVANDDSSKASEEKYKYYKLGNTLTSIPDFAVANSTSSAKDVAVNGAAYFDGDVKFFTTSSVTTDETIYSDAKTIYWGEGSVLKYADAGSDLSTPSTSADAKYNISSIAVCNDSILLGLGQDSSSSTSSSGGIEKVEFDENNKPKTVLGTFTTNAQTQLLSSYKLSIIFNTNPADNETDSSLYAGLYFIGSSGSSSVSFSSEGLWSYYPTRGNWNRE